MLPCDKLRYIYSVSKLIQGALKLLYEGWRADIIKCRALTEAIIDFGEDEGIEDEIYGDGNSICV